MSDGVRRESPGQEAEDLELTWGERRGELRPVSGRRSRGTIGRSPGKPWPRGRSGGGVVRRAGGPRRTQLERPEERRQGSGRRHVVVAEVAAGAVEGPRRGGETAIGCGHTPHEVTLTVAPDVSNLSSWFELVGPAPFGPIEARWIVCCAACLRSAGGVPQKVTFREHWVITGARPSVHDHLQRLRALPCDDEHDHRRRVNAYLEELGETDPAALVRVARAIGVPGL